MRGRRRKRFSGRDWRPLGIEPECPKVRAVARLQFGNGVFVLVGHPYVCRKLTERALSRGEATLLMVEPFRGSARNCFLQAQNSSSTTSCTLRGLPLPK